MLRFRPQRYEEGLVQEELVDRYENGSWEYIRKNETTYNKSNNKKLEQIYFNPSDDGLALSWKDVYVFEEEKLVQKTGFKISGKDWVKTLVTYYSYNGEGQRTQEEIRLWSQEKENNNRKTSFEYSRESKRIRTNVEVWNNNEWVEDERRSHTYQKNI